jgi:hypothetical protein
MTVFTWMMDTPVWASTSKTIRYTTPLPLCQWDDPMIEWYRQPGLSHTTFQ